MLTSFYVRRLVASLFARLGWRRKRTPFQHRPSLLHQPLRARLGLELLEDRLAPATTAYDVVSQIFQFNGLTASPNNVTVTSTPHMVQILLSGDSFSPVAVTNGTSTAFTISNTHATNDTLTIDTAIAPISTFYLTLGSATTRSASRWAAAPSPAASATSISTPAAAPTW